MPSTELYFCCSFDVFRHCSQYRKYSKHIFIINNYSTGVRCGLAINISYPTSANEIIVILKTPTKYREFLSTLLVKQLIFSLFVQLHIFGIMAYNHVGSANQSSRVAISNDSVFNSNRYPTISSVVYIATILPIVFYSQSAVSDPLPSMHVNVPLSTPVYSDHFTPPYLTVYSLVV